MTPLPKLDEFPKGRETRAQRAFRQLSNQRRWIEFCEANGKSYAGKNGPAIRNADQAALACLETEFNMVR